MATSMHHAAPGNVERYADSPLPGLLDNIRLQ
jgi:hypothetical protein